MDKGEQPQQQNVSGQGNPVAGRDQHIGTQNIYLGAGAVGAALPFKNPLERPVAFTGRETEIRETRALLEAHHRVALIGPGGIGKTAIAAEVLFQLAPAPGTDSLFPGGIYSHDFYRQAGHEAALLRLLGQAGVDLRGITDVAGEVLRLFAQPGVLLYLEGCEKAEDLMALLNLTGQSKVLLTSRYQDQTGDAVTYEIRPLPEADGAQLLHFLARKAVLPADPALRQPWLKLSRELGGHALALRLAGAWMGGQKESPEEFAASQRTDKFGDWAQRDQQRQNLHLLFAHSADAAAKKDKHALEIWFALALHAHAPVPLPVLCASVDQPDAVVRKALAALVNLSLAERGEFPSEETAQEGKAPPKPERAWQLTHALLGEWAREQLPQGGTGDPPVPSGDPPDGTAGRVPGTAMPLRPGQLAVVPPGGSPGGTGQWPVLPRREEILRAWRAWWRKDLKRCWDKGAVPGGPARYAALQPHWESLLRVITQVESQEQCELSAEQNSIAEIHRLMGSYSLAQPLHERALATSELTLGPEHPGTLASLCNLAILLSDKGDLAGAEPLYRRDLAASERTLGPEHPDTLTSLNNLAILLRNKGDLAGAEPLYRRALEIRERTLGPEHPDTLMSLNNLAILMADKGDLAGAEPLYRRALEAKERTLGPEHPSTLSSLNNLAILLRNKGDLAGAEPLLRRALEALERALGPEHPDTLMSLNNLAVLLEAKGELAAALPLYERAVRGAQAKLLPEHPHRQQWERSLANLRAKLSEREQGK